MSEQEVTLRRIAEAYAGPGAYDADLAWQTPEGVAAIIEELSALARFHAAGAASAEPSDPDVRHVLHRLRGRLLVRGAGAAFDLIDEALAALDAPASEPQRDEEGCPKCGVGAGRPRCPLELGGNDCPIRQQRKGGEVEYDGCHADRDGDCDWQHCPQVRDGEPVATGRHCPRDKGGE